MASMSRGGMGKSCQLRSRSSLSPWNNPASMRTLALPVSRRYLEPVTVRAAPRNVIEGMEVQYNRRRQAIRSMQPLLDNLRSGQPVIAAELRPPRAELETSASMDAWIDTYHAVRSLTRGGTFVFLTDSAV